MPLISDCSVSSPSRDSDGFCYIQDDADARGICDSGLEAATSVCDAESGVLNEYTTESMCPCGALLSSSEAAPESSSGNLSAKKRLQLFPSVPSESSSLDC